jgi:glycosyltransferase involved in cell wall biosynthesis
MAATIKNTASLEDNRKISVAIPVYNRTEMCIKAFQDVYDDERISEIVIVDDASELHLFEELKSLCEFFPKVKLYRNLSNQDCYQNKAISLGYTNNEFSILLDSDNVIDKSYLDRIYEQEWSSDTILTPSFAAPLFDFRPYEGLVISRENVAEYIDKPMFETMLNAANYFVSPYNYLEVFDEKTNPVTSDSIYQIYNWLLEGNKVKVVPGLTYHHEVHSGSHYINNVARTPQGFHETILNNLRNMK